MFNEQLPQLQDDFIINDVINDALRLFMSFINGHGHFEIIFFLVIHIHLFDQHIIFNCFLEYDFFFFIMLNL